jgi:hypothetical protein
MTPSVEALLDEILEVLNELQEQQTEIINKLDNLNLPGTDFHIFDTN